jgi:hypothetical protein
VRSLRVLLVLAIGCSSAPSASSIAAPPANESKSAAASTAAAPSAPVSAALDPSAVADPHDAVAEWRQGRREPARREVAPFRDVGIDPLVVTRRGRDGAITLHMSAVSDGAVLDVRLRAEVRCRDSAEGGAPDFSIGGSIGELDASGKPDFSGTGLGGFSQRGTILPNTPRDVLVSETLAGFPVGRGSAAWLSVGVISRCGEIDGQSVVVALLPNGTPILRPATARELATWGAH